MMIILFIFVLFTVSHEVPHGGALVFFLLVALVPHGKIKFLEMKSI